eukprot:4845154-Prymnesium_polylepis.2
MLAAARGAVPPWHWPATPTSKQQWPCGRVPGGREGAARLSLERDLTRSKVEDRHRTRFSEQRARAARTVAGAPRVGVQRIPSDKCSRTTRSPPS